MKKTTNCQLKIGQLLILVCAYVELVPLSVFEGCTPLFSSIGLQTASASSIYGILGRAAPELALDTWIGSDGKSMAPIRLGDYRGKVVYLYFFQDW